MSTYLPMWQAVKALDLVETTTWLRTVEPAKGRDIRFYGINVLDVDLIEALRHYKEDLIQDIERDKKRNNPS